MTESGYGYRLATAADIPQLAALVEESIRRLVGSVLDPVRVEASHEFMGVDTQLIEDGTYFVVESAGRIVGCGGWSRRATMFGGDDAADRDPRLLDPGSEPARIRAMYTHPDHTRKGIGRRILSLCEEAAAGEGFQSLELVATVAGEPLYAACGYSIIERIEVPTSKGVTVPCARMARKVSNAGSTRPVRGAGS
jgi:GNAT superfamily N-acetyltransferase